MERLAGIRFLLGVEPILPFLTQVKYRVRNRNEHANTVEVEQDVLNVAQLQHLPSLQRRSALQPDKTRPGHPCTTP